MARNGAKYLREIKIRVGEMAAAEPDALRFCFNVCTEGTELEGAIIDIEEVPLTGQCVDCKQEFRLDRYLDSTCSACGGEAAGYLSGLELDIVSIEVD